MTRNHGRPKTKRNITMKASKRSNDKKINLKPKDLTPNKDPRGGVKVTRPGRDGLSSNHNEMFLVERNVTMKASKRGNDKKVDLKLKDLAPNKDPRAGVKVSRPGRDGLQNNHNEVFLAE